MLSHHPDLNPAVRAAAELLTDGMVTDSILRDAAVMGGLPLFVERAPYAGPSALDLAERAVASAEAELRTAQRCFAGARKSLGEANRWFHPPLWKGGPRTPISAETRRREQSQAMRFLNSRRALVRRAEKALTAARAALLALAS